MSAVDWLQTRVCYAIPRPWIKKCEKGNLLRSYGKAVEGSTPATYVRHILAFLSCILITEKSISSVVETTARSNGSIIVVQQNACV